MAQKYAVINADGTARFYAADINENIPAEAIAITDEQWQEYQVDWANKRFVNGQVVTRTKPPEEIEQERVNSLRGELDRLELTTARAFIWLVKKLVAKNVLAVSDIPQQLRDYQTRMDEINTELGN